VFLSFEVEKRKNASQTMLFRRIAKERRLVPRQRRKYWTNHSVLAKESSDVLYVNAVPENLKELEEIVKKTKPRSISTTSNPRDGWFKNLFAVRKIESTLKELVPSHVTIKAIQGEATAARLAPGHSLDTDAARFDIVASRFSEEEDPWKFLASLAKRTRRDGIVLLTLDRPLEDHRIFQRAGFEMLDPQDNSNNKVVLRAPWRYESPPPGHTYLLTQESMSSVVSSCPNRKKTGIGAPVATSSIKDRLKEEEERSSTDDASTLETEIIVPASLEIQQEFREDVVNRAQQCAEIKTSEYDPLNDILDETTRLRVELEHVSSIESASCASLCISFVSMALHRPVRSDVTICANLQLDPEDTGYESSELVYLDSVSHIESRLRSARCASIQTVVLASSQRESVEALSEEVQSGVFIEYCDTLEELFDLCFCEDPFFAL